MVNFKAIYNVHTSTPTFTKIYERADEKSKWITAVLAFSHLLAWSPAQVKIDMG